MTNKEFEVGGLYHTCRWCKYLVNGKCVNERAFEADGGIEFHPFYEDGVLSEAIKEGFGTEKFERLQNALFESSLSKKKQAEIMKIFHSELDDEIVNWIEKIDDRVSTALEHFDFGTENGVEINDPSTFYCRDFW